MKYHIWMALGGTLMFIGIVLFLVIVTLFLRAPKGEADYLLAETVEEKEETPAILEKWSVWVPLAIALILIAYALPIWDALQNPAPHAPGVRTW